MERLFYPLSEFYKRFPLAARIFQNNAQCKKQYLKKCLFFSFAFNNTNMFGKH